MKLFFLTLLLLPAFTRANYLAYVDDKGTKHIVETELDIPEKYRAAALKTTAGAKKDLSSTATSVKTTTTSSPSMGNFPGTPPSTAPSPK